MQDPLPIKPITGAINGQIQLPGSKSISNRALILAALAKGKTILEGMLFSRDTEIMLSALETLGFTLSIDRKNRAVTVEGNGGGIPTKSASLHVGNAGTAARFLTAFLATAHGGKFELDGDPAMRKRPMAGLIHALESAGAAEFEYKGEAQHFPFVMHTRGFSGGAIDVDARASSQILSALLFAAPTGGAITLNCPDVRPHYVAITERMRSDFGAAVHPPVDGTYHLEDVQYAAPESGRYAIEPDLSAASYLLAATLLHGGQLTLDNIGPDPLQGDARFADMLIPHGLEIDATLDKWKVSRSASGLRQLDDRELDFSNISDTFLTYAAISPLLGGTTKISGIGHTRLQETDRVAGMANELAKLGQSVAEEDSSLTIVPNLDELQQRALKARHDGTLLTIDTYEDHRFAMSFGVLGSYDLLGDGEPWLAIKDPTCCAKTYPEFFEVLNKLEDE